MREITDHQRQDDPDREHQDPRALRGVRLVLATRARRWWVVVTLLLASCSGPLLMTVTPSDERAFAIVNGPVQLLMSITAPFVGVLLAQEARRRGRAAEPIAIRAALAWAVGTALFGAAVCSVGVAMAGGTASGSTASGATAAGGLWRQALGSAVGGVVVQSVCQFLGIGFGLVIRRPVLACLATFSPLGISLVMGLVESLGPARAWLMPAETAVGLLAGDAPGAYLRELVVVLAWWTVLFVVQWGVRRTGVRRAGVRR